MHRTGAWALAALLLLASPAAAPVALAGHGVGHDPLLLKERFSATCRELGARLGADACDAANFFPEAATDGYVLQVQRTSAASFEVRVRHSVLPLGSFAHAPLAGDLVDLDPIDRVCAAPLDCEAGLFLHTLDGGAAAPVQGAYPPQRIASIADPGHGGRVLAWRITFEGPVASAAPVAIVAVVQLDVPHGAGPPVWARGFYHPLKLLLPLDTLDAVPYPASL